MIVTEYTEEQLKKEILNLKTRQQRAEQELTRITYILLQFNREYNKIVRDRKKTAEVGA
jgi:hypothetical protein